MNNNIINSLRSIPEFFGNDSKFAVVVPKIQRAYAQGRNSEEGLRNQFVEDLFAVLEIEPEVYTDENGTNSKKEPLLELSFIYGAKSSPNNDDHFRFELLDGQQRMTTLILLYWYVASAENKEVPTFIKSFTYETRTTSTNFIERLSENTVEIDNQLPSEIIRSRQWYTISFDKDSSVNGMLNMLDTIHNRYSKSKSKGSIYEKLHRIKFYELDLEDFGLTEEIYVKMNARGLQLTPFENFKADLVKFMKREDMGIFQQNVKMEIVSNPEVPYYLNFSQKLDNLWLNVFWEKEDKTGSDYCNRYFRFFYHFFATKTFLEFDADQKAKDFRPQPSENKDITAWDFFWSLSNKQDKVYRGFQYYNILLESKPKYINIIEHILDWFSKPGTKTLLEEELKDSWNNQNTFDFFKDRYRLSDAVMFAAVCEYVERSYDSFDETNFRRWMRIVRNAIGDQFFRNVNEVISLTRNLVVILNLLGATKDIYAAIANATTDFRENITRNIRESITKAKIIVNAPNQNWESVFNEAEDHPLFAGSINFLLYDLTNPEAFEHRAKLVGELFDVNGMTEESKRNHRLIRALVRQLNSRSALLSNPPTTLTEKQDSDTHLRSFLLEKEEVGRFLCKLGDMKDINEVYSHIDSFVDEVPQFDINANSLFGEKDMRLTRAFKRICLDTKIYDFIKYINESKDRSVIFSQHYDNYTIDYKGSWYFRIYIGTERIEAIKALLENGYVFCENDKTLGYEFKTNGQKEFYAEYGDVLDNEVWLQREIVNGHILKIAINHCGQIKFCFDMHDSIMHSLFTDCKEHERAIENLVFDESVVETIDHLSGFIEKLKMYEKRIFDFTLEQNRDRTIV